MRVARKASGNSEITVVTDEQAWSIADASEHVSLLVIAYDSPSVCKAEDEFSGD